MIKIFIDLLGFLRTAAPFLTSLIILALLCVLLSKSIKRYATAWYIVFALPFFMVAIPTILRWCGIETFNLVTVPILGEILRDYIHMAAFGHPLLVIIMYMGALDTRNPYVKRLMSIRKELSVISGFPVLTHSLIRVANNFTGPLKFFTNHAEFMENTRVTSELGAGINNFSMVLGIVMLALFLPLWVTSFDSVRKSMKAANWKKLQKWAYVLYATLFIHAMGIHVGGMLNPRGGGHGPARPAVETTAAAVQTPGGNNISARPEAGEIRGGRGGETARPNDGRGERAAGTREVQGRSGERPAEANAAPESRQGGQGERTDRASVSRQQQGGRAPSKGFADFTVSSKTRQIISIVSLFLVYGSYLWLRVRKARKKRVE